MLRFANYIAEQTIYGQLDLVEGLSGNIGTERRGISHLKNYIMPFLSAEQRKQTASNFKHHEDPDKLDNGEHGEKYNPDPESTTHTLAGKVNGYESGTAVKVTGVRHDEQGKMYVQTANHGEIPASKLNKPGELKKPRITEKGFDVERKIAENLGTKAAGSTGTAFDYAYKGKGGGEVNGKVRKMEGDKPELAGESKLNKAKMGNSAVAWDPDTKQWAFSHQGLKDKFAEARHPGSGLPLLEHLNTYHSDGKIDKGFTVSAAKGTARTYLKNLGVNSLHLHKQDGKKGIDHGTSYTIGNDNDLHGKTKLGHLNDDDLDRLDGKLTIEKTTTGSARVAHVPNFKTFSEYASKSINDPENHRDLTNAEHANEFRDHIDAHIAQKQIATEDKNKPINPYHTKESIITEPINQSINEMLDTLFSGNLLESNGAFKSVLAEKITNKMKSKKKTMYKSCNENKLADVMDTVRYHVGPITKNSIISKELKAKAAKQVSKEHGISSDSANKFVSDYCKSCNEDLESVLDEAKGSFRAGYNKAKNRFSKINTQIQQSEDLDLELKSVLAEFKLN